MARFYATFNNSTVSSLQAQYFERTEMASGTTIQSNMLAARSALSTAAYGQINSVNQDGSLGIVVPTDAVTRSGGNYSWSNLYTNTAAIWPSNPATRPTQQITIANSTAVSPTDAGTISDSLYVTAQASVESAMSACANGGPRSRLGVNPWRTLASLHHDHAFTYIAWDDYTPGQPGSLAINVSTTLIIVSWPVANNYQFPADVLADVNIAYVGTINGVNYSGNTTAAPGASQAQINYGSAPNGAPWSLEAYVYFSYSSPLSASGATTYSGIQTGVVGAL